MKKDSSLVIYTAAKGKKLHVTLEKESVWLTQAQISELFQTERSVITKHINNIFHSKELVEHSNVQKMHVIGVNKPTKIYSLDTILSVGYRVNSKRATEFRIWANKILKQYILQGYALNQDRMIDQGYEELDRAVSLIKQTINSKAITSKEAKGILSVITDYAHSWILLHRYDEGRVPLRSTITPHYKLTYTEALTLIGHLTRHLRVGRKAAKFVGMERDDHGLERIIGSINQTYDGAELYDSVEVKAAHLLYFVIKDHPLVDGNKRSGSLLFIHFLSRNDLLYRKNGEKIINDNTIVALALLISQSHPKDKDIMIRLITNLLQ